MDTNKDLPVSTTTVGKGHQHSMRYTILDNPPWLQSIALGFQVRGSDCNAHNPHSKPCSCLAASSAACRL